VSAEPLSPAGRVAVLLYLNEVAQLIRDQIRFKGLMVYSPWWVIRLGSVMHEIRKIERADD